MYTLSQAIWTNVAVEAACAPALCLDSLTKTVNCNSWWLYSSVCVTALPTFLRRLCIKNSFSSLGVCTDHHYDHIFGVQHACTILLRDSIWTPGCSFLVGLSRFHRRSYNWPCLLRCQFEVTFRSHARPRKIFAVVILSRLFSR